MLALALRAVGTLGGGARTLSPALSCGSGCAARSPADTPRGPTPHWRGPPSSGAPLGLLLAARTAGHWDADTQNSWRWSRWAVRWASAQGLQEPVGLCGVWSHRVTRREGGGRPRSKAAVPAWAPSSAPSSHWVPLGVSPPRPVGAPSREARRSGRPGSGLRLLVWHPTLFQGSLRAGSPSPPTCEDGIPAQRPGPQPGHLPRSGRQQGAEQDGRGPAWTR